MNTRRSVIGFIRKGFTANKIEIQVNLDIAVVSVKVLQFPVLVVDWDELLTFNKTNESSEIKLIFNSYFVILYSTSQVTTESINVKSFLQITCFVLFFGISI